ncbi:MAG: IgGFc-binding protein, partial [Bacteroidales bacterium]|nr:IgGFc-binding protein [Bacteroidales bacterium]
MKKVPYIIIALLLSVFSIQAQNTDGKEFWVTYGQNSAYSYSTIDLQIRIVSGDKPTTGTIYFTNIDVSVYFNIGAREVFTYVLSEEEKQAVYNTTTGITNYSVHITGSEPVSVYALNQHEASTDATNVLPVTALSTAYYHISYTTTFADAYAVIATEDNTKVYHNHAPVATIDKGYVYYKGSSPDMTGDYISSDKPIALFALTRSFGIFSNSGSDHLFQQMSPVNTWGKEFFAPVSHPVHDVVRIVASQDGTDITQTGGIIRTVPGAQTTLTNLQAGQFVELETPFSNDGCSIHATKPVGVCTYYGGGSPYGDAAPTWLPPIEQSVTTALIAPFISSGMTLINAHYATLFTPTAAKESLKVSIGGNPPEPLSGGSWIDNTTAEMSFYKMPLTNDDAAYYFTSPAGFVILCYGWGSSESYYYLAYSAMRDLQAAFYANDIHYQDLEEQPFCENLVEFRAETENMGVEVVSLEWYIDGVEYLPAHNQETWSKTFAIG